MMRKFTAVVWITLLLLIVLVACNNTNEVDNTYDETQPDKSTDLELDEEQTAHVDSNDASEQQHNESVEPKLDKVNDISNQSSLTALVNKKYRLDTKYVPNDLVKVEVRTVLENPEVNQLREAAADALKNMFEYAEQSGIIFYARSGYRSYQTQYHLFQNHVASHGEESANRFSANAGESEHQTGLAMDVTSESVNYQLTEAFGETTEGIWISENAHKFGFIVRYPVGKEDITGYTYEPWHLRYLGRDIATKVFESELTYEEFLIEERIDLELK